MFRKILLTVMGLVLLFFAGFAVYVATRQNLNFDAPFPPVEASADSAVIARGHYLVRYAGPCASCHGDTAQHQANVAGADVPLSGGALFDIPPGKFYVPNITPDPETGLGNVPANAIARALRHGVGHDGRALLPFMEFQGLSDEDLVAVVSYLKSQPPVRNPVPAHQYNLLGKVIKATVLAKPVGPRETPPAVSPRGATVENGHYLVEAVGLCGACHSQRDQQTGAYIGAPLTGATGMADEKDHSRSWSPPNITAAPQTGKLASMSEDDFVARFRAGRLLPGSPMPWQAFSRMNEDDLRAVYLYLKSVPAAEHDVGPPVVDVKTRR